MVDLVAVLGLVLVLGFIWAGYLIGGFVGIIGALCLIFCMVSW